jgi:hypothetical protein
MAGNLWNVLELKPMRLAFVKFCKNITHPFNVFISLDFRKTILIVVVRDRMLCT